MKNPTHKRRFWGGGETAWDSDGISEWGRFRFREGREALSSSSESAECVRDGVADRLRDGGDGCGVMPRVRGDGGS